MNTSELMLPFIASLTKFIYFIFVIVLPPVLLKQVLRKKKLYIVAMVICQLFLIGFTFVYGNYRAYPDIVTAEEADIIFDALIQQYEKNGHDGDYSFSSESNDDIKIVYIIRDKNVFIPDCSSDDPKFFDCRYCDDKDCLVDKKYSRHFLSPGNVQVSVSPIYTQKFPEDFQWAEFLFTLPFLWSPYGWDGTVYMERDNYYIYCNYYIQNPYSSSIKYVLSPVINFKIDKDYSLI